MDRMITANIALDVFSIILALIPTIFFLNIGKSRSKLQLYFWAMSLSNVAVSVGDITDWLFQIPQNGFQVFLIEWGAALYFAASGAVCYFFARYMIEYMRLNKKQQIKWIIPVSVAVLLQGLFSIISPFTGAYFYVTEIGYQRGSLHLLSQFFPLFCYVILAVSVVVYRKKLDLREKIFFLIYIFVPLVFGVIQLLNRGLAIVNTGVSLALILIFVNIQFEYEIKIRKQETELSEQRIALALSQIQPHFLYNSLGTIAELCRIDPEKAERTTIKFSSFLRANMDSLNSHAPIPFSKEIDHVENYLFLEQQRFGDRLRVVYNICSENFSVPSLSVQPLVENAVVHGVLRKKEGGCITISTSEGEEHYSITISDDGIGMERSKAMESLGNHAHVGIENVRNRIESMVNGTLKIDSDENGTTITIKIPKN